MASFPRLGTETVQTVIEDCVARKQDATDDPKSLNDLVYRLKKNVITHLKLGWHNSQFLKHKSNVLFLDKALTLNKSVNAISIGWHIRDREILSLLFQSFSKQCQLSYFRLVMDIWIPEDDLKVFIDSQCKLITIDLRSVEIRRRFLLTKEHYLEHCLDVKHLANEQIVQKTNQVKRITFNPKIRNNNFEKRQPTTLHNFSYVVVPTCNVIENQIREVGLEQLHLADCLLTEEQVVQLANFIKSRGDISLLSLRMNKKIGSCGLKAICQAPVRETLDISLCDLKKRHASAIAEGIAARDIPLGSLVLCGNYQIGTLGLIALLQQRVCNKLVSINFSYCDVDTYRAFIILQALSNLSPSSILREVYMHGADIGNSIVANATRELLQKSSLRVLKMNDPRNPTKVMNAEQLRRVLSGLRDNFEMEDLDINFISSLTEERQIWCEVMFHLELNRAGRRILKSQVEYNAKSDVGVSRIASIRQNENDWFQVLCNAGMNEDLSVLFWIVRQGSHNIKRQRN